MLPTAARGLLRSPAFRPTSSAFRIAPSTQWPRSMASINRRGKKPIDFSKPPTVTSGSLPSSIGPQRSTPTTGSNQSAGTPQYSKQQDEYNQESSPDQNKIHSKDQDSNGPAASPRNADENHFSDEHGASKTNSSTSENIDPQSTSSSAVDPAEAEFEFKNQPLPDLTQGIPSTLEYELRGNQSSRTALNLTEDPNQETPGSEGSGPEGRPRGELPASAYISSGEKKRLRVANYLYAAFAVSCVVNYVYLGRNWESEEEESEHPDSPSGWALGLMWSRAKARIGDQLNYYKEPAFKKLLPDPDPSFERPYTLVISLEDLLIHSEWTREHGWRMGKRPGLDYFLRYLSQYYEIVLFTSVPFAQAEPIIRKLDPYHIISWPLYREATMYKNGEYVKDLSYLNRDLSKVILIDTDAAHAKAQPSNAIILPKWKGDVKDKELVSLIPFLEYIPTMATPDVRKAIESFAGSHIPTEFATREAAARKKFQEQMAEEQKKRPKSGLGFLSNALGVKPMMQMEGEQSPAEAFAQGKMLQDQARERGQKNYEALEKMIREEGEKWLKEEAAQEEMMKQEGMKAVKSGLVGFFGVPQSKPDAK